VNEAKRKSSAPGSNELLRLVLESATDFAIFTIDPAGVVTSWNVGAERLLGYGQGEMVGRDGDVIFTPEDRAAGAPQAERAKARADGRAEDERWHQRKDGSRFWGSGLLMPLHDHVDSFAKILRDRTEHHQAEERLRENEARFRLLATSIPQLVFRSRGTGERTWGSPQWEEFTGLSDPESRELGWLEAVYPEDREATLAAWRDAQASGAYYIEHRICRSADGEYRWHQTRARPVNGDAGTTTDWVGTSTDIHELRGLQERQQVLMAELQHRTRNLLALIQSMARQTLRTSGSLEAFGTEFESRLRALSRVQGLLAQTDHEAIDLYALVAAQLAAHRDAEAGKVTIEGPPVEVPPGSAQALALALHELATNAVKYGALGQPSGKLSVTWDVEEDGGRRRLTLDWRESGVPMSGTELPTSRGYGSELIERALPYQLKAKTKLEFGADGVRCAIAVPVPAGKEKARA
jgi:PAS domain S-box-containing protein